MTKELVWKEIIDFPDYEISNYGTVRNKNGKIIKSQTSGFGYKRVAIYANGKQKRVAVHRLVMKAFKPNEHSDVLQVNHKDGNKSNNYIDNLEWCTASYNIRHRHYVLNKCNRAVRCVEDGQVYRTIKDAARLNNSYGPNIIRACQNGSTAKGLHWEYLN
jgi:hypothetical protein